MGSADHCREREQSEEYWNSSVGRMTCRATHAEEKSVLIRLLFLGSVSTQLTGGEKVVCACI